MANKGVNVVVFNEDETEVLLHKRADFRIWALPRGHIESGESWKDAAIREVFEETGYKIEAGCLIGEYSRPQMPHGGAIVNVCLGQVISGEPIQKGPETLEVRWFSLDALPSSLPAYHRECIQDAKVDASTPFRKIQRVSISRGILIRLLFCLRDVYNRFSRRD